MNFIPGNSPSHSKDSEAYWFLFCEDQMLIDADTMFLLLNNGENKRTIVERINGITDFIFAP